MFVHDAYRKREPDALENAQWKDEERRTTHFKWLDTQFDDFTTNDYAMKIRGIRNSSLRIISGLVSCRFPYTDTPVVIANSSDRVSN